MTIPTLAFVLTVFLILSLTGFTLGDLSAAENCISHISGLRVATKSSPNYAGLATPFNLRMNPQPGLIVSP